MQTNAGVDLTVVLAVILLQVRSYSRLSLALILTATGFRIAHDERGHQLVDVLEDSRLEASDGSARQHSSAFDGSCCR